MLNIRPNSKVLILGAGRSGLASAKLIHDNIPGVEITIYDKNIDGIRRDEWPFVHLFTDKITQTYPIAVLSPGIGKNYPIAKEVREMGTEIVSELDLAFMFCSSPIVAITGTNGKTTTTSLIAHLLNQGEETPVAFSAGNIGYPFATWVEKHSHEDICTLEVSSYQMETTQYLAPDVSMITNVTPDHLERHGNIETYLDEKVKLLRNTKKDGYVILNGEDERFASLSGIKAKQYFVHRYAPCNGFYADRDYFYANLTTPWEKLENHRFFSKKDLFIKGEHNVQNALFASLAAYLMGATLNDIADGLKSFKGVEHRIEFVRNLDGVEYYNDSKATNYDSTISALNSFDITNNHLYIIVGGVIKQGDTTEFVKLLREKKAHCIIIGKDRDFFIKLCEDNAIPYHDAITMDKAAEYARSKATKGDIVLLSPATASFDQFNDYEHRGRVFKEIVNKLS